MPPKVRPNWKSPQNPPQAAPRDRNERNRAEGASSFHRFSTVPPQFHAPGADESFAMNAVEVYSYCQSAAGSLLSAIDRHDIRAIEEGLARLRGALSSRESESQSRPDRLCEERLDAIEGVADELYRSVNGLRMSARDELERMRRTAPLLRHLTAQS
jgi:hypothetical protein